MKNTTSLNETKNFLATDILNNLNETEIQNILKMKNNEIINLKNDGSVFFKYRLIVDNNGKKVKEIYDTFTLKINSKLTYNFVLYGLKQKLKDVLAIEKTSKKSDGSVVYNNYTETELKELAKNRLEKFADAFENGVWTIKTEKINAVVLNAVNKTIYKNILNLRFNNIDKATALILNKENTELVAEIYELNEKDFENKINEFNLN